MLNYHIQELPDLHEGDEGPSTATGQAKLTSRILFPKLTSYSQFAGRKMIKRIAMESGVHEGVVMATLDALPRALKSILLEGHTCKIDSLGIFSLSLSFDQSQQPQVSRLNLKVDPTFMKELREEARFARTDSDVVAVKPSKGHLEEHLRIVQEWFAHHTTPANPHPSLTLSQYATLTGVSRSTASRELKQITTHPEWDITAEGTGNRKVWVKKNVT